MSGQAVSIIIDSYGHEAFVAAAIESALAQDYPHVQVIVVDDGSPDGSAQVIERYCDRAAVIHQANQGQIGCCRTGFAQAVHDIIIFLDSDDLLDPTAARLVAEHWTDNTAKIQWSLAVIDENGQSLKSSFPKYRADLSAAMINQTIKTTGSYPDSPTSGNAYSRRLLTAAFPIMSRTNGFDGELNGLAPLFGDVLTIAKPLGSYRIHQSNSYAQTTLDLSRFANYRHQSQARFDFVRAYWQQQGQEIPSDAMRRDLKFLEYELVEDRFANPPRTTQPSRLHAVKEAIIAAWLAPEPRLSRCLRLVWFAAVAYLPQKAAKSLIEQRYVPARRWRWLSRLAG